MASTLPGISARPDQTLALNMKLVSHHELQGFGGIGEGMGMQLARDGRSTWSGTRWPSPTRRAPRE